ncbi:hypothetical protein K3495_g9861 [Podosphaera aphanis]|nr:hypothetical protein K3495_g9861 [Podosphaera aphanis]
MVDHPYIQVLDIWELDSNKKKKRKTRLVNVYDNWVGEGMPWSGPSNRRRRAIDDMSWDSVIENRTILLGDFNTHSPYWNPARQHRQRADGLESIIKRYDLIVNNDTTIATRPKQSPGLSIIDLTLTTPDIGLLPAWTIDPEYATPSDHELITFDLEKMGKRSGSLGPSTEATGWAIKNMINEQEQEAQMAWHNMSNQRPYLSDNSSQTELNEEAQWITETLTSVLDQHVKKLRVCARSKRWWSQELNEARSSFKTPRRHFQRQQISIESYKIERNSHYRKIGRARDQCFDRWIQGDEEIYESLPKMPSSEKEEPH